MFNFLFSVTGGLAAIIASVAAIGMILYVGGCIVRALFSKKE